MQEETQTSYTEKQKTYIYKYRESNKDKINTKLRERYANNSKFRERTIQRNKEYYKKNKNAILKNEKRKLRMRLYARIKYYERRINEVKEEESDNNTLMKYIETLGNLKQEYESIIGTKHPPTKDVKQNGPNVINDNVIIQTESVEPVQNIITITDDFITRLNLCDAFNSFTKMMTYIIHQTRLFSQFTPKSLSAGICMYSFIYVNKETKPDVSFIIDLLDVSITTIKKVCKEIKKNEDILIPKYIQDNFDSLKDENQYIKKNDEESYTSLNI